MAGILVLLFIAAIGGGIAYLVNRHNQAQIARAKAIAAEHGLEIDVSKQKPPAGFEFDLFDEGHSKQVRYQMWRPGEPDSVFQYQYTTGSGDSSRTYRYTGAQLAVPFHGPKLSIATETWWTRAKRVVGMRDIEIESPDFNDRYHVRCADERFAVTLLDHDMIAFMLSESSGLGAVTFEIAGDRMLCYGDQVDLEQLPAMLAWAQSTRGVLPRVLSEWYPPA